MKNEFKILDVVALKEDIPSKNLLKGFVGTIVEIFEDNTYLIEFSDKKGRVYAKEELKPNLFLKLFYEPESALI